MSARESLYDVEWQVVRIRCSQRVSSYGGWGTPLGTKCNLVGLERYVDAAPDPDNRNLRLYRVNNLLTEVLRRLQGKDQTRTEMYELVHDIKYGGWTKHYFPGNVRHSWEKVREDLRKLVQADPELFSELRRDLSIQYKRTHDVDRTRPELRKFLGYMKEVLG